MPLADAPTGPAPVGHHHILELERCPARRLADPEAVCTAMRRAIEHAGLTLIELAVHRFAPHGVTAVALLAESHLSVHTWPETGYAAADLFSCGDRLQAEGACRELARALDAAALRMQVVGRGPSPALPRVAAPAAQSREHSNSE